MSGNEFKIAIIGMAGVFPQSDSIAELWNNLLCKKILVKKFEEGELAPDFLALAKIHGENFLPFRGAIHNLECFDHEFFKMTLADAIELDPQQRFFLQVSYNALRDSGHTPNKLKSRNVGVYASCSPSTYVDVLKSARGESLDIMGATGNLRDLIAARVSYAFNLHGPAVNVQTGCSSSLSAVYEACKGLLSSECEMAIVGGSSLRGPQNGGHVYQEGGIYSKDGLCRPFNKESSGTVTGNGCAALILKRYEDALSDGDRIYCVINTILANNDGNRKASIAAPSVEGQSELISDVLSVSKVAIEEIAFIETHGTGTALGDAVELEALKLAFSGSHGHEKCAIGSIKANIGHLDSTSGITGLIKATLSLYTGIFPAHPSFQTPNPVLKMSESPFFVNSENLLLHVNKKYAGVNSLGIGGTNVFAILEKIDQPKKISGDLEKFLPVRVARKEQIEQWKSSILEFLELNPNSFDKLNCDVEGSNLSTSGILLRRVAGINSIFHSKNILKTQVNKIVFVFPGGGSYYRNALSKLSQEDKDVRILLDKVLHLLESSPYHTNLISFFNTSMDDLQFEKIADEPTLNLLITFIINHVVASSLLFQGIKPDFFIGHSLGEYNALVLSGYLGLTDAIKIVHKRGEIFSRIHGFQILNLSCDLEKLKDFAPDAQVIALNGLNNLSVVLPEAEVEAFSAKLLISGIPYSEVNIHVPAHSIYLNPYLQEFRDFLSDFIFNQGTIPVISNVSGKPIQDQELLIDYLAQHLRETVKFSSGINYCLEAGSNTFIQIGAGFGLVSEVNEKGELNRLSSIGSSVEEEVGMYLCLGKLLSLKSIILDGHSGPNYPFVLKRCWPDQVSHKFKNEQKARHFIEVLNPVRSLNHLQKSEEIQSKSENYEVLTWNIDFYEIKNVMSLLNILADLEKTTTTAKRIYLVRSKGEKPQELLALRSIVTSFNLESRRISVKILSFPQGDFVFDYKTYHSTDPHLECAYFDHQYEYALAYAHYLPEKRIAPLGGTLIVGGLGRVGMRLAEELLLNGAPRIYFSGRSELSHEQLKAKVKGFAKLSSAISNGKVSYHSVKGGRELAGLLKSHPELQALVFCASASDKDSIRRSLHELSGKDFREQMEAKYSLYQELDKVRGTLAIPKIIFISSNASRLSGPEMLAYAYSNAQIDQLCCHKFSHSSISFDAFRFSGDQLDVENYVDEKGLMDAYGLALSSELGINIIMSNDNFSERVENWVRNKVDMTLAVSNGIDVRRQDVKDVISQVFGELLGFGAFENHHDFFQHGGHSLLAFRALGRINSLYGIRISMKELKIHPTPELLGVLISGQLAKANVKEKTSEDLFDIDKLLEEME